MRFFGKLTRKIKSYIARSLGKLMQKNIRPETLFIEEYTETIRRAKNQPRPTSILCSSDDSPIRADETIELRTREMGFESIEEFATQKFNVDLMELKLGDLKVTPSFLLGQRIIRKEIEKSFGELPQNDRMNKDTTYLISNKDYWHELNEYASQEWGIDKVGFTKVPRNLIFKEKCIAYPYALIFMQELKKEKVDTAPRMPAGIETIRVYAELGKAVNDIAGWLRKKGVKCQPNHPLGGLTLLPALAGKAGLGWQGKMGLLVTPEFGVRQRLAPIFIEHPIFEFTDSLEHRWIEDYCHTCGLCSKLCPGKAVLDQKKNVLDNVEGIGQIRSCIEPIKCFEHFILKFGCSICMKVCPFSAGNGSYQEIRKEFGNRFRKEAGSKPNSRLDI